MDKNVTVSLRTLLLTGVMAIALVAAYLLGASGGAGGAHAATVAKASASTSDRTIDTEGVGTVSVTPDQLGFSVDISQTRKSVNGAFAAANAITKKAVASLKKSGVKAQDISTSGLSTSPAYSYKRNSPPVLKGYRVSQQLSVVVDGVKRGGTTISNLVGTLGISARIEGVSLQVADADKYLGKARDAAVTAAKAKATQYAKAAGGSLGEIVTVREVPDEGYGNDYGYAVRGAAADSAAVPASLVIESGQNQLSVSVEVVWSLS